MGEVVCRYAKLFTNLDLGALLLFAHGEPWHFTYLQLASGGNGYPIVVLHRLLRYQADTLGL